MKRRHKVTSELPPEFVRLCERGQVKPEVPAPALLSCERLNEEVMAAAAG